MLHGLVALGLVAVVASNASAQRTAQTRQRLLIPTFHSADKALGVQAAEALRARVARDAGERGVYVVPKVDIDNALSQSGYPTDEALAPHDARELARQMRADEYVEGMVTRTPAGVRVDVRLVLARDNAVTQLLPPSEASRPDQAMGQVSRDLLEARRQAEHERECAGALRAGDPARAIAAAERGLRQHPRFNNMIRVCLATAYVQRDTPQGGDPVVNQATLELVQQILQSDPRSIPALRFAAAGLKTAQEAAEARGDTAAASQFEDRYIQTLTSLVAADPNDLRLQEQVVNALAASGRASLAVPIIMDALQTNPGDPRMLRTAWLVLLAAREFERAIGVGEELVRFDTAAATPDYFRRLAIAYNQLNRRPEATAVLERAVTRFPSDAMLLALLSQNLREAGQTDRALQIIRQAITAAPNNPELRAALIQTLLAATPPRVDEAATEITAASSAGVDRALLAQLALAAGDNARRAAVASRSRADWERAVRLLSLSHSMQPTTNAQFLLGFSQFSLGDILTREAQAGRSCSLAQTAQQLIASARTNITATQSSFAEAAQQLLSAIPQYTTSTNQMVRAYCR